MILIEISLLYSNENLVLNTSNVMKSFANNLELDFNHFNVEPTIGGRPWGGNSAMENHVVEEKTLNNYKKVLDKEEIDTINKFAGTLREEHDQKSSVFFRSYKN